MLGIGDNTADIYVSHGTMYPGGNAVNVAVLSARLGHAASYVGCVGDDAAGNMILQALRLEGVDLSRCRQVAGTTSWSRIEHRERDRFFVGSSAGVQGQWTLTEDDLSFAAEHRIVHTSIYSDLDAELPRLRQAAATLSYDFSSEWTEAHLERVASFVDVAFLSCDLPEAGCLELAADVARRGTPLVVVTRGAAGSLALHGEAVYRHGTEPANVVDTLGAGDALIAGFLNAWAEHADVAAALAAGARYAAQNCSTFGAFGHGVPLEVLRV
nr:PfkB family carbohydrate kinase [Deinobacterium chartae]